MVMIHRPGKTIRFFNEPARARDLTRMWTTAMLLLCVALALPAGGALAAEMVRVKVKQANLRV